MRFESNFKRSAGLAVLAFLPFTAKSADFSLGFNSLPSAQGWTYQSYSYASGASPAEGLFFSTDGTKLLQNTMGSGFTYANYYKADAIDPNQPFTIIVTARVLDYEVIGSAAGKATALVLDAVTGVESFGFSLNRDTIGIGVGTSSATWLPFDATEFHTFRIEAVPGISNSIYADNLLFYSGSPATSSTGDRLYLGNASSYENGLAEITRYSFIQSAVPEPDAWAFMITGLFLAALRVKRRS